MENSIQFKKTISPFSSRCIDFKDRRAITYDYFTPLLSVNGFTIYLQCFDVYDSDGGCATGVGVYLIRPNHSSFWFVFRNIESAIEFCFRYENKHSNKFWTSLMSLQYLFEPVVRLTIDMLPVVAFYDPDLPF